MSSSINPGITNRFFRYQMDCRRVLLDLWAQARLGPVNRNTPSGLSCSGAMLS